MSLDICQIALHQLIKRDEQTLEVVLRDSLLGTDNIVQEMMAELHRIYGAKSKAFATFNQASELAEALVALRKGDKNFLGFSRAATIRLRDELAKYLFAEGGVVLFCQYLYLAVDYLLIAVLNSCNSMFVNDNLELNTTHYLDIPHVDIVARIDLTEWERNPASERYLTFLKGRVGRKVSDFFMDFLSASEGMNAKIQNKGLLQAVNDYCDSSELNQAATQEYRQQVYRYCNEQQQAGEEIELKCLSKELPALGEQNFAEFTQQNGYQWAESVPPDRTTLKQLTKYSGSGGGLTINFDALLLDERVFWDPATDTLTIKGTPPNLREQLERGKKSH